MANYNSKSQIKVAAGRPNSKPLHGCHISTMGFMQFDCAFAQELAPRSTWKGNHQSFVRAIAMRRPLFSNLEFHTSAYFVPFRVVWPAFNDFFNDCPHNTESGTTIIGVNPLISFKNLTALFSQPAYSTAVSGLNMSNLSDSDQYKFDFVSSGTPRKFTFAGRHAYKLLKALGYSWNSANESQTVSALPLLCLAKVYMDYFYPNAYSHYGSYAFLDGIMQRHFTYTLDVSELDQIFSVCTYVAYKDDYFVSAFDNPTGASDNVGSSDYIISDISALKSSIAGQPTVQSMIGQLSNQTPFIGSGPATTGGAPASSTRTLTQYSLQTLSVLTSYIRRHQLSGSRALERAIAQFGVALSADKLKRCYKLGEKHFSLQVGDVTSQSDTISGDNGAQLGDYAGRGVAFDGDFNYECQTDEFGMLIVISSLVPSVGFVQGSNRQVFHKTRLDYLNPEFDGLGNQPIYQTEIMQGLRVTPSAEGIFGFAPRYSEYATIRDIMSGDFTIPTNKLGLLGWESNRIFSDDYGDTFDLVHSLDFMLGSDAANFNRIFFDMSDDNDKFRIVHRINANLISVKRPLYSYQDFDDEDGKTILMDVNGVKSN